MIPVVVPSAGRPAALTTHKAFAKITVCIPERELGSYQRFHPDLEYVTHPDSLRGLALKRQWIYERFGDVFMVDDDVRDVHRRGRTEGEAVRLTGEEANEVVNVTAESARELGVFLFGFSRETHPVTYPVFKPLRLSGFVAGFALGLLAGSKLWFAEECVMSSDMWISALNAHFHRLCFVDERYGMNGAPHYSKAPGGMALIRTEQAERDATEFLRKNFGTAIVRKVAGSTELSKYPWARSLKVPW